MIATLLLLVLTARSPQVPAPGTRAAFAAAIAQVRQGWTKAQVSDALGNPDDIWPANDSTIFVQFGQETWCYGSAGHHSLPVLGRVIFENDVVSHTFGGEGTPPPTDVIDESTLVASMRLMHRWSGYEAMVEDDPANLIKIANHLIPLGKEKALAVMQEYSRIDYQQEWMFWMARIIFTSQTPGGVFAQVDSQYAYHVPNEVALIWPTYPVLLVDDVPFVIAENFGFSDGFTPRPESFADYVKAHRGDWTIRSSLLKPTSDPFDAAQKAASSPELAALPHPLDWFGQPRDWTPSRRATIYKLTLSLVRHAYRPDPPLPDYETPTDEEFEVHHSKFKETESRWDSKRSIFVRRDGRFDADEFVAYPQVHYAFKDVPGLDVDMLIRRTRTRDVDLTCDWSEEGTGPWKTAVMLIEDASNGTQLSWFAVDGKIDLANLLKPDSKARSKDEFLAEPPHSDRRGPGNSGFALELPFGKKIRFVILLDGNRYESPVLTP
jgi:hypothetical protein